MLMEVCALAGAGAIAQVDVGERRNFHQPLDALRPMADTVLAVVAERLRREGRLSGDGAHAGDRGAPAVRVAARAP